MNRVLSVAIYALSILIGVVAFIQPFLVPSPGASTTSIDVRNAQSPWLTLILLTLCLIVLLLEVQGQAINAKLVSALGLLVAATSVLRFAEVAFPGPGGFTPIFAPIILAGYVFGPRFGFLMGTLTLLVSGLITGGVGPWLPYQMFVSGWLGLLAGWLPHPGNKRLELFMLAAVGFVTGVAFGAIMNLYFWPFVAGDPVTSWQDGLGLGDALGRYLAFYLVTSFGWDLGRAIGNVLLIAVVGAPVIRALSRFRHRLRFEWVAP